MNALDSQKIEKFHNIKAASALLGSSRITIIRWIREGKLRAFKFPDGRLWRIRESDLQAFIESGEEGWSE